MISGYGCYVKYLAIKSHFQNEKYDYFKYNGGVRVSEDNFNRRPDRFFFEKLAKKLKKHELVEQYIVSNMVENSNIWIGEILDDSADNVYKNWKQRIESISYRFEQDFECLSDRLDDVRDLHRLFKVTDGNYPIALQMMLGGYISKETIIILNNTVFNFLDMWKKEISDKTVFPDIYARLVKYEIFFKKYITKEQFANFKKFLFKKLS